MAHAGDVWGRLETANEKGWSKSYDLADSVISIGRGQNAIIRIPHLTVSNRHCILKRETKKQPNGVTKRAVMVEDMSTNGTYINKLRIRKPTRLRPGDELCVSWVKGKHEERIVFTFQEASSAPKQGSVDEFYVVGDSLGSGAFATVHQAVDRRSGKQVAVKMVDKRKFAIAARQMGSATHNKKRDLLRDEYNILRQLDHDNVVRVFDAFEDERTLFIVMEYVRGGELFDFIVDNGRFEEDAGRSIFRQMLQAVSWLHAKGISHRDLKPENILLQPKGSAYDAAPEQTTVDGWKVKISDFGMSRLVSKGSFMKTLAGTPHYLAPEVLTQSGRDGAGYDHRVDMWSLGVILYTILSGTMPFSDESDSLPVFEQVKLASYSFPEEYWGDVSDMAKDMIRQLLRVDPSVRLTADEALKHPWMVEGLSADELSGKIAASDRTGTQVLEEEEEEEEDPVGAQAGAAAPAPRRSARKRARPADDGDGDGK